MKKDTMENLIGQVYLIQGEVEDLKYKMVCSMNDEINEVCEFIGEFAKELEKELEGIIDDEE